jgi:hypothetical protein
MYFFFPEHFPHRLLGFQNMVFSWKAYLRYAMNDWICICIGLYYACMYVCTRESQ